MPLLWCSEGELNPHQQSRSLLPYPLGHQNNYMYIVLYIFLNAIIFFKKTHTLYVAKGGVWMKKYANLNELLLDDMEANKYFAGLPDYMKSQMNEWSQSIDSFETLKNCSEKVLRWDD